MSGEAPTFTFSSLDAHNRCRGLFNGTKGWAFITPSGVIDTEAFPLVIPERRYDKACMKAPAAAASSAVKRDGSTRRPGDKIIRKMNENRRTPKEVERLVNEAKRPTPVVFEAENMGEDWETEGGRREGERRIRRTGQPIVLTLQDILAATSKTDSTAAFMAEVGEDRHQCSRSVAIRSGKEGLEEGGCLNLGVPQVADPAHFPPLMMRGASSEENGLYLSPTIMMVKRPSEDKREETGQGGVCSSEAVEATRIAESVQAMSVGADVTRAVGRISRVGWWSQWTGSVGDGEALVDPEIKDQGQIDCFEDGKAFSEGGWEVLSAETLETDGGAWELVATEKCEARGCGGSDAEVALGGYENGAESWCDCSSNVGEVGVYEMLKGFEFERNFSPLERKKPMVSLSSESEFDVVKACRPRCAANSKVWGATTPHNKGTNDKGFLSLDEPVNQSTLVLISPSLPPVSLSVEHGPLSYRDMLMTPIPAGVIPFTKSSRLGMRDQGTGFNSSPGPAVVDYDTQGSTVFGWREAETVEDWGLCGEVEDPYYARKRLGAFAYRTKPRGREHK